MVEKDSYPNSTVRKAKKICISSLKLRETGKIRFRPHIKPLMLENRERRKKPLILIALRCFLNFTSSITLFLVFLEKSRYFSLRQKLNHLLNALFWCKAWKIWFPNHSWQPFNLEGQQRLGVAHSGQLWGSCVALAPWPRRVANGLTCASLPRWSKSSGQMVYGSAGQLHRVQRAGSRRHEKLWKMVQVRLEKTHVRSRWPSWLLFLFKN